MATIDERFFRLGLLADFNTEVRFRWLAQTQLSVLRFLFLIIVTTQEAVSSPWRDRYWQENIVIKKY